MLWEMGYLTLDDDTTFSITIVRKLTPDSLRQYNEVIGLKSDEIEWTDGRIKKISREESVIDPSSGSGEPNEIIPPTEAMETDILRGHEPKQPQRYIRDMILFAKSR